jgi:hypothetical protein
MMIGDVLNAITERLHSTAHVKTIYGEPIVAEGKTIIPVAEVKYGFGGGGGQQGTRPTMAAVWKVRRALAWAEAAEFQSRLWEWLRSAMLALGISLSEMAAKLSRQCWHGSCWA